MRSESTLAERKILFVAESPSGGAGAAANRLYEAMKEAGLNVRYLVLREGIGDLGVWTDPVHLATARGPLRKVLKALAAVRRAYGSIVRWRRRASRDRFFHGIPDHFEITTLFLGRERLEHHPWYDWADVVHLHWTAGFLAPRQRWTEKQWVISLHDANPFTSVCHFPADCRGFETGCQTCPQLEGSRDPGYSQKIFARKRLGYGVRGRITLHAPSQWIADLASRALLTRAYPTVVIPNLFPTQFFRPLDTKVCRDLLGLPPRGKVGLFVAGYVGNVRKGFPLFLQLAEGLVGSDWTFAIVGGGGVPPLPPNCLALGKLTDLRLMAAAYSAADVFVSTTLQDTVPATVIESQLCGTPVIGFAVGGQTEMVQQGRTGYLVDDVSIGGLREGLKWFESVKPSRQLIANTSFESWNKDLVTNLWQAFYARLSTGGSS